MQDLLAMPDWNRALSGAEQSSFVDGSPGGARSLPDGTNINLTEVANLASCGHVTACSASEIATNSPERHWLTNNPVWQLYAYGPAIESAAVHDREFADLRRGAGGR